jgi:histone-lysine N-methyltransferase SETD2
MGACENSFEPHEPLTLAATEQHSCLEFIKDSEQLPVLETAHSLIDTNVEPSSATDGFVDLSQKDNVVCASHSDVKAVSADMGIGLTGEGESVVGLTAGKLLEDESGVIGGCLDERQSGIDDCNGETDRSREEKAGLGVKNGGPLDCERSLELLERNCDQQDGRVDDKKTGVQGVTEEESDGLVTVEADTSDEVVPSTSCETSVESILGNDMTRNCDQQDDQNDHESGSVQGVMEEKNDGLAAIKIVNSDEIVLSLGSEMPTELMQAKDWSRNGDQQDDQRDDKNVSVQGVMEQHSSGLAPIEFDDIHHEIVLSSGQGMPAELLPEKGLPSDGNEQYKHDCGTSQEAVMEEKIDNLTGLENRDLQAVMEQKSDGLVATKTADTCENILPSLGYEMPAERLPRNGVEKDKQDRSTSMVLTMEERNNDLAGTESISMEGFMEEKSDGLAAIETATHNEIGPLSGCEIPAGLISVNGYGVELDKQYDGTSPTVVPKERSVLLTRLETDNQDQILPSLDHGMHLESTTVTCPPSKCLQPDDQKGDQIISCLIAGGVMEETSDALDATDTTTSNWLLSSQGLERTLKLMPMTGLPEESVYHDEQKLIPSELDSKVVNGLAIERVPEQESDASARIGADIYAQVSPHGAIDSNSAGDCSGETVNEAKNHVSIDSVSETKCHDIASPSSQRSNGVRKSSRKAQTKRAARKSRNTTKVPNLHLGIETVFKSVTRKRSCFSKPARSSAWGLLGNITHAFTMIDGPRLDEIENNGSQKARGGRGSRKRNNRAGGRSQRSSKKGCASASCIRLKVKVGKEACQTEANPKIMIPEVIDTKASAELVSNYGVESYQETSFEMSKLVHYAEDNVAEEGAGKQLQSFDIKLKAELHCDPYGMDVNLANKDMEGMVIFEKSPGDTVEDYIGVPLHTEVEALGATTEKRYTDPGTSPDSEVINLVAEGQVDARCPEDFHDAVLSSSKAFATDQGGNGKRRGKKKERLPQAANCSPAAASLNKVKLAKKRGGRQRKADGLSSTEILTSSSSVNGLINTPSSKECSAEQVPLSRETELEVSGEVLTEEISMETKICVGGLDAELRSSESQISKNPLPSTKSRGNGVNKGRSKVSDSAKSRRANGCKDRGNDRKSVKKNKAKGKSVCDHVFYKVDDDPEIGTELFMLHDLIFLWFCSHALMALNIPFCYTKGQEAFCSDMKYRCNHTADENGKIDAVEDTAAEEVADLDTPSSGVMEQNLSPDNAWVRCDDCLKWRRIPVRLVESISQTHCQWYFIFHPTSHFIYLAVFLTFSAACTPLYISIPFICLRIFFLLARV